MENAELTMAAVQVNYFSRMFRETRPDANAVVYLIPEEKRKHAAMIPGDFIPELALKVFGGVADHEGLCRFVRIPVGNYILLIRSGLDLERYPARLGNKKFLSETAQNDVFMTHITLLSGGMNLFYHKFAESD